MITINIFEGEGENLVIDFNDIPPTSKTVKGILEVLKDGQYYYVSPMLFTRREANV